MEKFRFSMLLLEPGEIYFEDYSCSMIQAESYDPRSAEPGRLKLCSKSLVFEPRHLVKPLIKLQYKDCIEIVVVEPQNGDEPKNMIKVTVQQYAEMLEENILAPYKFKYENQGFLFAFDFARAEECLIQMQQLQRASTLHPPEHNSMVATILHSRYMRMRFDPVMMDDFTEDILLELLAEKISPLVKHQGKLALTPTTLYFQPFNNIENSPILKIKLCHLRRMYKRRFLLRHVGLELYSESCSSVPHIYLSFQAEKDRDTLYSMLEQSQHVNLERVHAEEMTLQWQNGVVSNYDYLMYLNCLADRSKNDLTQYPVFPWVVADYKSEVLDIDNIDTFRDLSKPMGALNPERLERLMERYHEMPDPKFMYGSHYSAPGLVLFYLVRKYPQYMLCLQNGRFDHPDRMFNSVADVYNNCLRNMSDFKELVPEFYDTDDKGDFLVNKYEINFGERHDSTKVNDVTLPPWAKSPEDFVQKLREALESEYVSRHLHLWIDLIFGCKQRGREAVNAHNVFYHLCYEGSVDLECIYDMNDRHALEVQIMEFGQVPKQLFTRPHVRKITHDIPKLLTCDVVRPEKLECYNTIQLHKEAVTCVLVKGSRVVSVGKDGTLKVYDQGVGKQIRSVILCSTPLSSCVMIEDNLVAAGSWDNDIYLYDVEYGRVVEGFRAHDDSVSCLMWLDKEKLLVSGGWDGVVRAWRDVGRAAHALRGLRAELDHDARLTCLTHTYRSGQVNIITGTSEGEISIWNLKTKEKVNKMAVHTSPVTGVCHVTGDRVVTTSEDGDLIVTDLTVAHSGDCRLTANPPGRPQWDGVIIQSDEIPILQEIALHCQVGISRLPSALAGSIPPMWCLAVYQKRFTEPISSVCWDGRGSLWLGGSKGTLLQWDMRTVTYVSELQAHEDSVDAIFLDEISGVFATAGKDKSVKLWRFPKTS